MYQRKYFIGYLFVFKYILVYAEALWLLLLLLLLVLYVIIYPARS